MAVQHGPEHGSISRHLRRVSPSIGGRFSPQPITVIRPSEYPTDQDIRDSEAGRLAPGRFGRFIQRYGKYGVIGAGGAALWVAYETVPSIRYEVDNLEATTAEHWNSVMKIFQPSTGEVFNPYKTEGEITSQNSETLSLREALDLIAIQTNNDHLRYILLPDTADRKLTYEIKSLQYSEMTGISGLKAGDSFVAPYDAMLMWSKYEKSGAMSIKLRKLQPSNAETTTNQEQIEYVVQDAQLAIPDKAFNTNRSGQTGTATITSSEVSVKAGQKIFTLTSDRTISGSYAEIGDYQAVISGARILAKSDKAVRVISVP